MIRALPPCPCMQMHALTPVLPPPSRHPRQPLKLCQRSHSGISQHLQAARRSPSAVHLVTSMQHHDCPHAIAFKSTCTRGHAHKWTPHVHAHSRRHSLPPTHPPTNPPTHAHACAHAHTPPRPPSRTSPSGAVNFKKEDATSTPPGARTLLISAKAPSGLGQQCAAAPACRAATEPVAKGWRATSARRRRRRLHAFRGGEF
jgi:hypothetical protein